MYLLIDNYDSFTYNLADLVAETGRDVQVCRCDQIGRNEIAALNPQGLIISPGPKRPEDAVHSLSIVRAFCRTLPILGVCLGMHGDSPSWPGPLSGTTGNLPGHALSFAGCPAGNAACGLYGRCRQ